MKHTQQNPNGFRVNILDGREISDTEAVKHADNPKLRTGVVNGPHHDAKWARHLAIRSLGALHRRSRFGTTEHFEDSNTTRRNIRTLMRSK